MNRCHFFVFGLLLTGTLLLGQRRQAEAASPADTLTLTLAQAEAQFRSGNLQLLASQAGISENQAYEYQARLINNPTIYVEQMPYNHQTGEFMPFRRTNSEQVVQVQQLLLLAGKRNKQLAIARQQTTLAADRFYDLIRTLTYQVRSTFYDLYYARQALGVYGQEISTLRQTVNLFKQQYDKGNIPLKDLARLKAYLFNLTTEQQQFLRRVADANADLTVLLNVSPTIAIQPTVGETAATDSATVARLNVSDLYQTAEKSRFDLKAFRDGVKLEQQNLILQKALAVPDLTLQGTYDRNAGFIPNYFGIGVGSSLPFFNRNQGNIKAAAIRTQSSQQLSRAYQLQVEGEVQRAYEKALQTEQLYYTFDNRFNADFARLIEGVITNYRKQNIDVVEFLDFFDSYKNSQIQYNQLQNDRQQSLEALNFAVGANVLVAK
ncbi:TolC family protein [Spirosoma montaniterrae]|uniref:Transporter n=1 Tax=Spirosoma montaniterrae TaxID=1178516 RepID=A0A1P9X2P3_9BACT|nr:TolC family protein [Spirosoma montaniterrae]AQG81902.1 hypothetical protein AWR27_22955 [Spirosoma montaniterrae]